MFMYVCMFIYSHKDCWLVDVWKICSEKEFELEIRSEVSLGQALGRHSLACPWISSASSLGQFDEYYMNWCPF